MILEKGIASPDGSSPSISTIKINYMALDGGLFYDELSNEDLLDKYTSCLFGGPSNGHFSNDRHNRNEELIKYKEEILKRMSGTYASINKHGRTDIYKNGKLYGSQG